VIAAFDIVKRTVQEFLRDECTRMAASLSYYVIFALPPLIVLLLVVLGTFLDADQARTHIQEQFSALIGPNAADQIHTLMEQAETPGAGRGVTALLGGVALLFGATGAFVELQTALNRAWGVKPDPSQGGVRNFIFKRALSLGMVMGIAFLLLVSLVLGAVLALFGDMLAAYLPDGMSTALLQVINLAVSLVVITLLFAAIFRFLPDARLSWGQVWVGAAFTTLLFVLGKTLIGFYLGNSNPGRAYGAASSLAVLLVWIYYSSIILLFGAEFTEVWNDRRGHRIVPESGATVAAPPAESRAAESQGAARQGS
jgi:membrane protein